MTVINTNIKALYTQGALKISQRESRVAMQQLSTGKRINSAKDDAAGLAIAARMTQNIQSLNQSVRNAGDAISFIQTAEGATNDITSMLQRMSELAVQSSNATYSPDQRGYLNQEFQQLKQEIVRIAETHEWNGFPILNGKAGTPVGSPTTTTTARPVVNAASLGKSLAAGDLQIVNASGVTVAIPASLASNDKLSSSAASSSSKSGSAIAIAAAINSQTATTGVVAKANGASINGTKTTMGTTSVQTDLYINGTKIPMSLTAGQTAVERRQYVIDSVNANTATHGVKAGDAGNGGVTLTTVDGRNLSVWYDGATVKGSDFGLGLNTSTSTDAPGVTGMASATAAAAATRESSVMTFSSLTAGQSVSLNGLTFTSTGSTTAIQVAAAFANLTSGMTAASVTSTNTTSAALGSFAGVFTPGFTTGSNAGGATVTATATADNAGNVDITQSSRTPTIVTTTGSGSVTESSVLTFSSLTAGQSITVNGLKFTASANMASTQVAAAYASLTSGMTASQATAANTTSSALGSYSGTFTTGFATGTVTGSTVTATSATATTNVTDIAASSDTSFPSAATTDGVNVAASTVYGTVTLDSITKFTLQPGANAYPAGGTTIDPSFTNFSDLGLTSGIVNPKNIGRLNFQVGPSPDQLIYIDMGDFGKNGDITGSITSDTAPTNISTVAASMDVIAKVNVSLDRVAATRATMGAVMNRLQHVVDNLTNVSMNSEASRSQIEDADYAAASTELARTQIMQQAATAVLAQANTDMQTVMKLLQ